MLRTEKQEKYKLKETLSLKKVWKNKILKKCIEKRKQTTMNILNVWKENKQLWIY